MATILIVDDDDSIRSMMRMALKSVGHQVEVAENGTQALNFFGEGDRFDLVLLDQFMPGMDGLEVLRKLKKLDPKVKALMATGYGSGDLAREAIATGANGFLRKPFSAEVLLAAIITTLRAHTSKARVENDHFDAVSVNGFRLEPMGEHTLIGRHEFKIHGARIGPSRCIVELSKPFIETVKSRANRENLQHDVDFWRWLSEEALANHIWQHAAPPEEGFLEVKELTFNLSSWMQSVLSQ